MNITFGFKILSKL